MNLEGSRQKGTTTSDKNNFIHAVKNILENFPEEFVKDSLGAGNFDENFRSHSPLGIAEIKKIGVLDMNILKDKEQTMEIEDDNGTFEEKLDSNCCNDFYQQKSADDNGNADTASSLLSLNNSLMQDNEPKIIKKMKKKKNSIKKASTSSNAATSRTINSLNSLGISSKSFL
jgi:hypothetical protein